MLNYLLCKYKTIYKMNCILVHNFAPDIPLYFVRLAIILIHFLNCIPTHLSVICFHIACNICPPFNILFVLSCSLMLRISNDRQSPTPEGVA